MPSSSANSIPTGRASMDPEPTTRPVVARRVVVTGRVQGVFFRSSCRDQARRLGVVGWVRNTAGGSVELWAEGAPAHVDQLLRWCREGPGLAEVDDVDVREEIPTGPDGFHVR